MSTNKEKASWLASLLTGWGIKEVWAKIIAGAIVGALAAAGILTQNSCQYVTPEQVVQVADMMHEGWHATHPDKPCIIPVQEGK